MSGASLGAPRHTGGAVVRVGNLGARAAEVVTGEVAGTEIIGNGWGWGARAVPTMNRPTDRPANPAMPAHALRGMSPGVVSRPPSTWIGSAARP